MDSCFGSRRGGRGLEAGPSFAQSSSNAVEESVSSSTPDNAASCVRCRSVSFGAGFYQDDHYSITVDALPAAATASNRCSILESILLNRGVPPSYSSSSTSVGPSDGGARHGNPPPAQVRAVAVAADSSYKRPRLRSLPLPSTIPPGNGLYSVHLNRASYLPPTPCRPPSGEEEGPACLAFKRRKVSLESDCTSEENDVSLRRDSEFGESSPNGVRKGSVGKSILHSLLSFDPAYGDRPEKTGALDGGQRSSEPSEADTQNLDQTVRHVDSSLRKLALGGCGGDRGSRHHPSVRRQRVVIAKKLQLVVDRKVRRWLAEIAQLAAKYRDLTDLPQEDWKVLLRGAASRLLLLYMAENDFQFAVAPVATNTTIDGEVGGGGGGEVVPAELPTVGSVEDIQRFIAKCQTLKVDSKEYQCMRLITLFHSGCTNGIKRTGVVDRINSGACRILSDLVRLSRPDDRLRYGDLLLHLHSLASVNSRMVQRLFCVSSGDGGGGKMDESGWLVLNDA